MLGTPADPKKGRPKTPLTTMPLIMATARSRVNEKVVMSGPTSRDFRDYVEWASAKIGIPEDEAMILTLDRALGEFLKKDKVWLEHKGKAGGTVPGRGTEAG